MKSFPRFASVALGLLALCGSAIAEPLKIAYSDWPGWVAWEIGVQKGWFKEAGVDVEFLWFDYVPSMDAYVAGKVDGGLHDQWRRARHRSHRQALRRHHHQ